MESKSLKTRSKVQYMKTLLSILDKKEPLYITYLAGLQRLQAGEQLDQAVAMTVQDMRTLIQQFPNGRTNWCSVWLDDSESLGRDRIVDNSTLPRARYSRSRIGLVDPPKDLQGAAKPPVSVPQVYRGDETPDSKAHPSLGSGSALDQDHGGINCAG
eukprot:gene7965-biopygen5348